MYMLVGLAVIHVIVVALNLIHSIMFGPHV